MAPDRNRKWQSQVRRVQRYLVRKYTERFGPGVDSVRTSSNSAFLKQFVGQATAGGDEDIESLLAHFSKRIEVDWPEIPDVLTDLRIDLSAMTRNQIIERADQALAGDLHRSGVRPEFDKQGRINWAFNPSGSREWLLMIHRHAWWPLWAAAYRSSGDEKYVAAFVSQLTDWIDRNPMPRQKAEHEEPWRLMEAGLRMRVSWIPVFGAFFNSLHFDDASKLKMLRALCDHGRFLSRFCTNRNHLVRESNGLIALALSFPEFRDAASWAQTGLLRLDEELRAQVNEDGSHIEMSVGYQWLTIDEFEVTRSILSRHGRQLPSADLDETLRRLYDFLAGVIRPDKSFPQLNDGFILWGADRLMNAARRSGWSDIEYAATAGDTGSKPAYSSRSFPNAGLHIMRSAWGADARYLAFDTGPYGGPHGHEDKLSFELFAFGAPFIIDPGSYTYEKSDPYRNYFVSSAGHNTVMVDQMSQIRRWAKEHITPATQDRTHGVWITSENVDFASGYYDEGYAPFNLARPDGATIVDGIVHQRDIVFVKPDYWIVVDKLDGLQTHDYEFLFHLAPGVVTKERAENGAVCLSERNGAQLRISAFSAEILDSEEFVGAESPIQGWYSSDHFKKTPSSTLLFRCSEAQSVCVAWLFYPSRSGVEAEATQVSLVSDPASSNLEIQVTRPDRIDLVSISPDALSRGGANRTPVTDICVSRNGAEYWSTGQIERGI